MKNIFTNRGLAFKMILSIFASISFVFLVIFIYNYQISKKIIVKQIEENARHLTLETVNKVNVVVSSVEKIPENITVILKNTNYSKDELLKILRLVVENNNEVFGSTVAFEPYAFDKTRKFFAPYFYKDGSQVKFKYLGDDNYDYFHLDWYSIPRELKKAVWSEPYYDEGGGNVTMSTISVPFYRNNNGNREFIGVMTVDVSLDWLEKIVSTVKVSKSGYAFMISKTGKFVTHPLKNLIMNETIFSIAEERNYPALAEIGRKMISGMTGFEKPDYVSLRGGNASWISYAPVVSNGWSFGIVHPIKELMADETSLTRMVLVLGIAGGIFLLLVIIFISESITKSLKGLVKAAGSIAKGNYDVELPPVKSKDEIGELTTSFGHMQGALRQTISDLENANFELEDYSQTLEEKVQIRTAELNKKHRQLESAYKNVKTLSEIGQKLTSTLELEMIFNTLYESVNSLLDATVFLILVYDKREEKLDCKLSIENNERLPVFSFSMQDKNRFAVCCVEKKQTVFMNDVDSEWPKYVAYRAKPKAGNYACSLIYLPLVVEDRVIGAISVQSYKKNAYDQIHLDILSTIGIYAAVALDNAYAYEAVNAANRDLKEAQAQLIQAEKMASLGQLTAGIAHEIKNPLNFINNFAELCVDLTNELKEEVKTHEDKLGEKSAGYIDEILTDLGNNAKKINEHGKRADSIVKGMLLHSRGKSGEFQKVDINSLLAEYVNLAYHGFRAQDSTFNIKIDASYDPALESINVVPQNLSRVFLNIINNACYSVHEKKKENKDGFNPVVCINTKNTGGKVEIKIKDNGKGISKEVLDKVFNPFFTTKPAGKGTGLGLSLSYDIIVQEHKGDLKVDSVEGEYAEFIITLPIN